MRIVGGDRRGLTLRAPAGDATRPTADRARQALFDMLLHAPWGGRDVLQDAQILDGFAGTGALGLEALSRGASHATFMEQNRAARAAISANIGTCRFESSATVLACDVTRAPKARMPCSLIFLDPPYGQELVMRGVKALGRSGWLAENALIVAETGAEEELSLDAPLLAERRFGAAKFSIWRHASTVS
ncbi:16S rRNA (guanine(966)-N(2))-methyltransferase RsmD [Kozakia baliensis]|uniref:16S rRNA (guanine(966)-N(2))-methyltransferase RsmD n=1 Tax=Kozakia baliensis TaxID=153496 RepID=UPI0008792659|nr:16S rRNA (guanine(966)-N(2))-methyltransferase RsmD [Kozakia baliensis]AOX20874.1 16S rRNA (guanine(966)-N(2))-methyltransferase RsmD [Kozakia baliensis]